MPKPSTETVQRVRVWDLPTRVFHWALAIAVTGLLISGTVGGNAMTLHFRFGYAVLALLLFRLIWGVFGGHWSRFAVFIQMPAGVLRYLRGRGEPSHDVGHNPRGALSVLAMLAVLIAQVGTGLISDDEIAASGPLTSFVSNATVSLATNYHANIGKWLILALIVLHIGAIIFYTRRNKRLVGPMWHGDKELPATTRPARDDMVSRIAALVVLAACGGLAFWVSTLAPPAF